MAIQLSPGTPVFVASGWIEREAAAAFMRTLEQPPYNLVITHDWTGGGNGASLAEMAARDEAGIRAAGVLIAVMTHKTYEYKGTWFEIGFALGRGLPVVLISPFVTKDDAVTARNVYFHHKDLRRFATVDAFLTALGPK
jgi:nucleoside 2-deoxyribosyltransferase